MNTPLNSLKQSYCEFKHRLEPYRSWLQWSVEKTCLAWEYQQRFQPFQVDPDGLEPFPEVRHIVVKRDGNIGDTVVAIPALLSLRQAYPDAKITLMSSAEYWENTGLQNLPKADEVLSLFPNLVDAFEFYALRDLMDRKKSAALQARLAKHGPLDLFVDLPYSIQPYSSARRLMRFAHSAGFRYAIGFDVMYPTHFRQAFARHFPHHIHKTSDWLVSLLTSKGLLKPNLANFRRKFSKTFHEELRENLGLRQDAALVIVNAGAKLSIKCWPAEKFALVILKMLFQVPGCQFVLLGSQAEMQLNEDICAQVQTILPQANLRNLCGQLSIRETMVLAAGAQGMLSNDTGAAHIAGLFDVPVVIPASGQFTSPLWEPIGDNYDVVRYDVACSGCYQDICPIPQQPCMTGITPEAVYRAVAQRLLPNLKSTTMTPPPVPVIPLVPLTGLEERMEEGVSVA